MQPDNPDDGLTGTVHDDGKIELSMWAGGKSVQSLYPDPRTLGGMAAMLLTLAHESAGYTGAKPAKSGSHADYPSIPISAYGLIAGKKKKTFALGFVFGEAQIAFQIPQSKLAHLGRLLLAASAKSDRPQ